MKNILAENMLRFGVKNLNESQIKSIRTLMTEFTAANDLPAIAGLEQLKTNVKTKAAYTWFTTAISTYGIKFSNAISDPALYLTLGFFIEQAFNSEGIRKAVLKGKDITKYFGSAAMLGAKSNSWDDRIADKPGVRNRTMIQFNESPSQKGKVLTVDKITVAGPDGSGPGQASDYSDIQMFLNDQALKTYITIGQSHVPEPYQVDGRGNIANGSFIGGNPKTTPGAGSLELDFDFSSRNGMSGGLNLLGSINFNPESSQTTGTTTTTTTFTPGPEIVPELGELFATGKIQLAAGKADEIAAAVKDAQQLGKIVKIRIESSASANRGTNMTRDQFAKMVGLPANQVPEDPKINNKSDNVTDPMEGGNAFLAVKRAQVAGGAVKSVSPVAPTITAKIQDGGDAAQYVKVFITVKKPDNTTTITQDELDNIGTGASNDSLAGKFQVVVLEID